MTPEQRAAYITLPGYSYEMAVLVQGSIAAAIREAEAAATERVAALFRKARHRQWLHAGYSSAHERDWESDEKEKLREEWNRSNKANWDAVTEALLAGQGDETMLDAETPHEIYLALKRLPAAIRGESP